MTIDQKETILQKVKKLLNLGDASKNNNPSEVASAMAKAQELLFKHNLTIKEVHGLGEDTTDSSIQEESYSLSDANRNNVKWKRTLLHWIAKVNFCRVIGSGLDHKAMQKTMIYGSQANIQIVLYFFEYLNNEVMRLAKRQYKPVNLVNQFCMGATLTIVNRLKEQFEYNKNETVQSKEMVVVSQAMVDRIVNEKHPRLAHGPGLRITNQGAFNSGQVAGRSIALNQGIGHKTNSNKLIN